MDAARKTDALSGRRRNRVMTPEGGNSPVHAQVSGLLSIRIPLNPKQGDGARERGLTGTCAATCRACRPQSGPACSPSWPQTDRRAASSADTRRNTQAEEKHRNAVSGHPGCNPITLCILATARACSSFVLPPCTHRVAGTLMWAGYLKDLRFRIPKTRSPEDRGRGPQLTSDIASSCGLSPKPPKYMSLILEPCGAEGGGPAGAEGGASGGGRLLSSGDVMMSTSLLSCAHHPSANVGHIATGALELPSSKDGPRPSVQGSPKSAEDTQALEP